MEYLILIISLLAVVFGADILVSGSVSIAKKFNVSDFVIGAAIIGIGTSFPELVVSTIGAIQGNSDVAIGNVVGSNIFNVLGILGVTSLFFPIMVSKTNMRFEIPLSIGVSVLLLFLSFNFFTGGTAAVLGRADGIILLLCFAAFMFYSFRRDMKNQQQNEETQAKPVSLAVAILKVAGGLAVLISGCHFFVENAVVIARELGVDDAFISITLIACGTSLPELAASVAAAMKKNTQMALGNIVGSNIFNITLILGLGSQITPLSVGGITIVDYIVMIAAAIFPALFGVRGKIGRVGGLVLFLCFVAYNIYLINTQIA